MKNTLTLQRSGSGEPLILLHGWGFHSAVWQPLLPLLEEHYEVYCIDLPGFGHNQAVKCDYQLTTILSLLKAVAPGPASYLGWSLGGTIAMAMALQHPEQVSRLCTLAATPKFLADNDWPGVEPGKFSQFSMGVNFAPQKTMQMFSQIQFQGAEADSHSVDSVNQILEDVPPTWALKGGLKLLANTDLRGALTQITCPQTYVFSENDVLIPIATAQAFKKIAPDAEFITLPQASHLPIFSHAQAIADIFSPQTIK